MDRSSRRRAPGSRRGPRSRTRSSAGAGSSGRGGAGTRRRRPCRPCRATRSGASRRSRGGAGNRPGHRRRPSGSRAAAAGGRRGRSATRPAGACRAASGIQRNGSHQIAAPYSEKARSKLSSRNGGTLGVGVHEREPQVELLLEHARRRELPARVVEPDRPSPAPREPRRPVGRAAAELDHVEPVDVGEDPEVGFGHAPGAPGDLVGRPGLVGRARPSCPRRRPSCARFTRTWFSVTGEPYWWEPG